MLGAKIAVARAAGALSRRSGRGATSLPGKLLMRMEPDAIARLAGRLPQGSAVISATNGKTTTAAMVAAILERSGTRLVHNRAGANMAGGVASVLLGAARGDGIDGDAGPLRGRRVLAGPRRARSCAPRALLLANLFRDQLDRYGELETIADRWAATVAAAPATQLVLNADDPLVADLGRVRTRGRRRCAGAVTYFGVQDDARRAARHGARLGLQALPPLRRAADLRRRLHGPPRPLALPQRRHAPPAARRLRHRRSRSTAPAPRASSCTSAASTRPSPSPSPASTTSTTRSAPPR